MSLTVFVVAATVLLAWTIGLITWMIARWAKSTISVLSSIVSELHELTLEIQSHRLAAAELQDRGWVWADAHVERLVATWAKIATVRDQQAAEQLAALENVSRAIEDHQ